MATSGYTEVRVTSWNTLKFSWETTSQSIANNTSTISWKLQLVATGSGAINSTASKSWVVKVYGNVYSGTNTIGIASNSTKNLASGTTTVAHKLDGTRTIDYQFSQEFGITFSGSSIGTISGSGTGVLETINRKAIISTAPNFTDEDNPTITYSVLGYKAATLMACISLDGSAADIPYRDISSTSGTYTFNLLDSERETLRQACLNSKGRSVKFYIRTAFSDGTVEFSSVTRTLTIVNAAPVLSPTAVDTNTRTLELTNNGNYIVKGYSNLTYNFNAVAQKGAIITSYKITCGSQVGTTSSGTLYGVDSGYVAFVVTDSRGYSTTYTMGKSLINYIKLTNVISDEFLSADGELTFNVQGNFFDGSFGLAYNSLELRYRSIASDGSTTSWQDALPVYNGDSYSYSGKITGLDYTKTYSVRVAARDTLRTSVGSGWIVVDTEYVSSTPVFDWSKTDFNFNVPVSAPSINLAGNEIGGYKILWQGFNQMDLDDYTVQLSEPISQQLNGIVLVFSLVTTTGVAQDASWQSFYKSKGEVATTLNIMGDKGAFPSTFLLGINSGFSVVGAKYIYFTDTSLGGNPTNIDSGTNSGISFQNGRFALRYVLGV